MNPYASFLGDKNPSDVIAATAAMLRPSSALFPQIKSIAPRRRENGASAKSYATLPIARLVFAYRIRQTLAEPHHVVQPFDQDIWAKPSCHIHRSGSARDFHGCTRLESRADPRPPG